MNPNTPRLRLENVGKAFNGRDALRDIGFDVAEHEFVALLGASGAGKTTLLRCVSGLLTPDHGTVYVSGTRVSDLQGRERRRVSVIFQQFNLVGRMSALGNVLAGRLGHVPAWRGITRRLPHRRRSRRCASQSTATSSPRPAHQVGARELAALLVAQGASEVLRLADDRRVRHARELVAHLDRDRVEAAGDDGRGDGVEAAHAPSRVRIRLPAASRKSNALKRFTLCSTASPIVVP